MKTSQMLFEIVLDNMPGKGLSRTTKHLISECAKNFFFLRTG